MLRVYYDGGCPVCRMEVRFYERRDKNAHVNWVDILSLSDQELPPGKTRDALLGRFHVLDGETWHIGVDAFARIWDALPGFRRFSWLFRTPGLRGLAEISYRAFLKWQQADRRRREAKPQRIADLPTRKASIRMRNSRS